MWLCPGCGSSDAQEVQTLNVSEAAVYFARPWVDPERYRRLVECISGIWPSGEARLIRCGKCELCSSDPFVAGTPEFFSLAYGRESAQPYPAWRWEYKFTQDVFATTSGSILDIGAGDGAFQKKLIDAGVDVSRLFATEYNPDCCRELLKLGVNVESSDVTDLAPAQHAVLCGHNVLQHLADLDRLFRAFDRLTADDGLVALSMSNGTHKAEEEKHGGLIDMPPNHISTWCYSAIVATAGRRGWKVVDYREQPVSRVSSAKTLAIARTYRSRQRPKSFTSMAERHARSHRARRELMALSAAVRFPAILLTSDVSYGGAIWVLMHRV